MKNIKPLLFLFTALLFLCIGNVTAQTSSTVMITTITTGKQVTLQVVDDENKTTSESDRVSEEKPEQTFLKIEMDKWLGKGFKISQSYGYSTSAAGTYNSSTRYETIILIKEE